MERTGLNDKGLCKRCAGIDWDGMAHAIEHFPIGRPTAGQPFHIFDIDTNITDTEDLLRSSGCRFCRLLAEALRLHGLITPGQLDCVYDGSLMASIRMDTSVPTLAITLDDVPKANEKFRKEYANIKTLDIGSIQSDIHACEQNHPDCTPDLLDAFNDWSGFKFIDCHTKKMVSARSTINTDNVRGNFGSWKAGYRYVALSYVWGLKRDESRIGATGTLENLPQTIDDSIKLCEALDYRYLWVDRYCIDQGNPIEKAAQISNMGRIYSSAQLTIIASVGEGPFYGLPGITAVDEEIPFHHERIKDLTIIVRPLSSITSITASKWATRGWTYQEGYLSRKRIFFTNQGVHYICNTATTNTILHRFLPRAARQPLPAKAYTEVSAWTYRLAPVTRNLEAYSARQLTVDSDALDAITGALNDQMMHSMPIHHLWGIPIFETDIDYDLSSSKKFSKGKIERGARSYTAIEFLLHWSHPRPRRRRPEFPSWSFLGWAGQMSYLPWPRQTHIGEHFNVHNLQVTGDYTFTLTPPGTHHLDVTTYTIPLALIHVTDPDDVTKSGYYAVTAVDDVTDAYVKVRWSKDPDTIREDGFALTGALFIDERKLLKEKPSTTTLVLERREDHYERVGMCTIVSQEFRTMPASVRTSSSTSVTIESWEYRDVSMQEWQQRAKRERISIG